MPNLCCNCGGPDPVANHAVEFKGYSGLGSDITVKVTTVQVPVCRQCEAILRSHGDAYKTDLRIQWILFPLGGALIAMSWWYAMQGGVNWYLCVLGAGGGAFLVHSMAAIRIDDSLVQQTASGPKWRNRRFGSAFRRLNLGTGNAPFWK